MSTREGWIGRPFLSRDGKIKGKVKSCSSRYCAACGYVAPCFVVEWEDGKRTKPCIAGVRIKGDEPLQIM